MPILGFLLIAMLVLELGKVLLYNILIYKANSSNRTVVGKMKYFL
jgi:hypothetical protein